MQPVSAQLHGVFAAAAAARVSHCCCSCACLFVAWGLGVAWARCS